MRTNPLGRSIFAGLKLGIWVVAMVIGASAGWGKEVVKVGLINPMSGDLAILKEVGIVMDKRMQELNKNPKNLFEYHMIIEDSKFEPRVSHAAALKLLKVDKVDVLMTVASLSAKVVQPLVEQTKVPHLIMGGEELAKAPWNFTYFTTASDLSDLAIGAGKKLGYKSFVIMGQRQAAGVLMAKALKASGKKLGVECKGEFLWNPGDLKDFRPHLLKARETRPDAIVFFPTPPDPDIFFRQIKDLGITTPVIGMESYELVEDKKWVEGRWISGCPPLTAKMREILKGYGIEPKLTYDPYAYDFPGLVVQAVETAGVKNGGKKPSGEQIREALADMKTVETSFGTVEQENNIFKPKPTLVYYENGEGREISLEELVKIKGGK